MPDNDSNPVSDLIDRTVVDPDGNKIGTGFDVYLDNDTGQPEWLAVTTGLFGTKVSFVPLAGASLVDDNVIVAHSKDTVKDAPRADADGQLSADEEAALYEHYGRTANTQTVTDPLDVDIERTRSESEERDAGSQMTDDAMTRSEEKLDVSTRTQPVGKARLRKWVETEDVQMTVPLRREKARLVSEPITDANRDDALAGRDLTDAEHEITLSEEVVDVSKQVVPKERVRLETDIETDEGVVDEQVRKERIEMDNDDPPNR